MTKPNMSVNELVGRLVRPRVKTFIDASTRELFIGHTGLIIEADWDPEDRLLYVRIFVNNSYIEREYKSLSIFRQFWLDWAVTENPE